MDIMEIVLLAAGGIVFILSFLIPTKKEETDEETRGLAKEEIKALVSEELEAVRGHVDDVVEEAVTYSIEKTERSLERLSNEKIMAVNEYSDTVLAEIHKNHEEVMFLYDMLNDKHINLKNTVSEVNRTVKEVKETKKEAEEVVNTFQRLAPETVIPVQAPASAIAPPIFATVPQEAVPPVVAPEQVPSQGSMMQPAAASRIPVAPPVFAAAPVPVTVPSSEVQKVSRVSRKASPTPQKVSMASRQVLPAAQKVTAVPPQAFPVQHVTVPQQALEQQVTVPQHVTVPQQALEQQVTVPQHVTVPQQALAQQVTIPPQAFPVQQVTAPQQAPVQQIPLASQNASLAPQKVSAASAQVSPVPQKVALTPVMQQTPVAPQTPVTPQPFYSGQVQGGVAPQPFRSGQVQEGVTPQPSGVISFTRETDVQGRNYNDRVLELYKSGKSNVAIARELNLGVGEVKLVIDLYKNRSEK